MSMRRRTNWYLWRNVRWQKTDGPVSSVYIGCVKLIVSTVLIKRILVYRPHLNGQVYRWPFNTSTHRLYCSALNYLMYAIALIVGKEEGSEGCYHASRWVWSSSYNKLLIYLLFMCWVRTPTPIRQWEISFIRSCHTTTFGSRRYSLCIRFDILSPRHCYCASRSPQHFHEN